MEVAQTRKYVGFLKKKVLAPKDFGDLRLGSLKASNLAFLVKWWWRYKIRLSFGLESFFAIHNG